MSPGRDLDRKSDGSPLQDFSEVCISSRLTQLEELVHQVVSTLKPPRDNGVGPESVSPDEDTSPLTNDLYSVAASLLSSSHSQGPRKPRPPTFQGETSIQSNLDEIKRRMNDHSDALESQTLPSPRASSPALTSVPSMIEELASEELIDLHKVSQKYNLELDAAKFEQLFKTFCDEIHTLYPFLHLPSLQREQFIFVRALSPNSRAVHSCSSRYDRLVIARLFICYAIGQCTASPRDARTSGRHTAGWSLYRAGMDFIGNIFDSLEECQTSLLPLQVLALMVSFKDFASSDCLVNIDLNQGGIPFQVRSHRKGRKVSSTRNISRSLSWNP